MVVQEQTVKSSAIVVFSGNGKTGYTNTGYQNRALEAVHLYKKGYADKIILTSGRLQTISEGELISAYLISKGIDKVAFDRGKYKYHGLIKILADAARSEGLNF
mgnify:CR=1 FL=1